MDIAALGISVDSGPVERAVGALRQMPSVARQAAAGAEQLAGSAEREARAFTQSTAAVGVNARAVQVAGSAMRAANQDIQRSGGLARHEMINLSRQVQDIGVSLVSGQSPFTVLVQQGTQVADIFGTTKGTLGGFAQQIGAIFTPMRLLAGGIVAVTAALAAGVVHVVNYARVVDDLAKMTGFAREELQALESAGAIKGLASDDVLTGVKSFVAQIEQAQRGTNDLAELFRLNGKEIGTTSENMATLRGLVRGAGDDMALIKEILRAAGIEPTMEWIRLLRDANGDIDRIKMQLAGVKISDEMVESSRRFAEGWASVWETVKTNASAALIAIANAIETVFSKINQMMTFLGNLYAQYGGGVQGSNDIVAWRFGGSAAGDVKALEAYADALRKTMGLRSESNAEITKSLSLAKEDARLTQLRVSILGDAATAADKEAAALARIADARRQGVQISKAEEAAIIANAVASKSAESDAKKVESALTRLRQARENAVGALQLEIANMFKSAEAARAEEIAFRDLARYKTAGVNLTPQLEAEVRARAKETAALERQVEEWKKIKGAIKEAKDTAADFSAQFVQGVMAGKSALESLGDAAVSIGDKLVNSGINQATKSLMVGDFTGAAIGGITAAVGWVSSFFGGKSQKDKAAEQAAQKAAEELAQAQQRWAAMATDFAAFQREMAGAVGGALTSAIQSARKAGEALASAALAAGDTASWRSALDSLYAWQERKFNEFAENIGAMPLGEASQALKDLNDQIADYTEAWMSAGGRMEELTDVLPAMFERGVTSIANQLNDTIQRGINSAQGKDYINQLDDMFKTIRDWQANMATLGLDSNKITQYMVLTAQNIVDSAQLTGDAFNDLLSRFPELAGAVREFSAELAAAARSVSEIASTVQGYQDQLFVAQQNAQTLPGALAIFDLQAQRDREAEIAKGGEALVALEALQAQQRLNIIADFNARAAADAQRAADEQKRIRDQQIAEQNRARAQQLAEQKRAIEQAVAQTMRFVESLREFKNSLILDASLSPLSPSQRLQEAQSQFQQTAMAAAGGDESAQGNLQSIAQAYLSAARDFFGSGTGYNSIFQSVNATLDGVLSNAEAQLSDAQRQLSQLEQQTSALAAIESNTSSLVGLMGGGGDAVGAGAVTEPSFDWLSTLPGYANGTRFHRGGLAMVGERGPEIVNIPRGSQVYAAGNDNSDIAEILRRILDVLTATGRISVSESARMTQAVERLSQRMSSRELSRARAV